MCPMKNTPGIFMADWRMARQKLVYKENSVDRAMELVNMLVKMVTINAGLDYDKC